MPRKLTKGDLVLCKLYNPPARHFYGERFQATVIYITAEIKPADRHYSVTFMREGWKYPINMVLHRKEILKVLS